MKWQDASEIALGLLVTHRIIPSALNPDHLFEPYDKVAKFCQDNPHFTEADLLDQIGPTSLQTVKMAASSIEGSDPMSYVTLLDKSYKRAVKASTLKQQAKKLDNGEESDDAKILSVIQAEFSGDEYVTVDQVDKSVTWRKTYYTPFDENIGDPEDREQSGVPEAHVIQLIGSTGTGKSSLALKVVGCRALACPDERELVYTFEMTAGQSARRLLQIIDLPLDVQKRIMLCETMKRAQDVRADLNRLVSLYKIGLCVVDFTELMIPGKADEQAVSWMYRELQGAAKETKVPIFALALPSRSKQDFGAMGADSGRMSSMGEGLSGLVLTIYNPNQTYLTGQKAVEGLTAYDGEAWVLNVKSRFGYRHGGPAAFKVAFDGKSAWGDETLVVANL